MERAAEQRTNTQSFWEEEESALLSRGGVWSSGSSVHQGPRLSSAAGGVWIATQLPQPSDHTPGSSKKKGGKHSPAQWAGSLSWLWGPVLELCRHTHSTLRKSTGKEEEGSSRYIGGCWGAGCC